VESIQCPYKIEVVADDFSHRDDYHELVIQRIKSRGLNPGIVFLDPDTGLEPQGKAGPQHVLESELSDIWENLLLDDLLVLYQHQTNRNRVPWVEAKKTQFEEALNVVQGSAKIAQAPEVAPDVAFFYVKKT
jgi:hypothetical protein